MYKLLEYWTGQRFKLPLSVKEAYNDHIENEENRTAGDIAGESGSEYDTVNHAISSSGGKLRNARIYYL